jgi:hypothetical protein
MATTTENIVFDTTIKLGNSGNSIKSVKAELRQLNNELANLEPGSARFVEAATRAGELQDRIGDVKNAVAAFNPEGKFKSFAGAVGIAANGFSALQGVMAVFGSESENLNRVIAQTQGAIALATGLNGLLGMKDAFGLLKLDAIKAFTAIKAAAVTTFTTLKGAMAATGIGALLVALGYLYTKFIETAAANEEATKKEKEYAEQTKKTKEATDEKVKSIELEIIAIKNKANASTANLIQAKAEKLALEEQIRLAEEHNKKQKEAYTTSEVGGKIITISNIIETDSLKKKLVEKNKEIESFDLIAKKTSELEKVKSDADAAEKKLEKEKQDRLDKQKQKEAEDIAQRNLNLKEEQLLKNKEQDKIATDIEEERKKQNEDDKKESERKKALKAQEKEVERESIASHINDLNEIAKDEVLSAEERYAALNELNQKGLLSDKETADAKIAIAEAEQNAKLSLVASYGQTLNQIANLLGKSTAEGKAVAIAATTIDTYVAAFRAYKEGFKLDPSGVFSIISAAAATATGIAAVQNIISTPVPGGGGGGGGVPNFTAPSIPQIPQSVSGTRLNQTDPLRTINEGRDSKVFVTETDITKTQNKVKNIIKKATIK